MPDEDILAQFQEFLSAKAAKEKADEENEDFDVEIWGPDGKGVRTKRSHARPFLQSLGLDLDEDPPTETDDDKTDKDKPAPKGKQAQNSTATSVARKYFTQGTKK